MAELKKGDKAPGFTLSDQNKKKVDLSDFYGQKILLYFYPRADTPGCTKQACSVRDNLTSLKNLGITVLGISPDNPEKQKKFDLKYNLGFPLLSDISNSVAEAYSVWREKSMYGKKRMGVLRSSFLIDEKSRIIDRWYRVKPLETVSKAMQALERYTS